MHSRHTLWHLSGQKGGYELVAELLGTIMDRHLSAMSSVMSVAKTLVHYLIQSVATPQQNTFMMEEEASLEKVCSSNVYTVHLLADLPHGTEHTPCPGHAVQQHCRSECLPLHMP